MGKIKNFEGINKNNIINMELIMALVADQAEHKLYISVAGTEQKLCFPLNTGFEIHACNEFLRSLEIKDSWEVAFNNCKQYASQIQRLMVLLPVQRLIDAEGSDAAASDVYTLLLDDHSDFGFNAHAVGLENGLLPEYVHKAIEILKRRPIEKKALKLCS